MTILPIMFPLVVTSKFILSEKAGSSLTPYHFLTFPLYGEGTGIQGKSKPVLLVDPTNNVSCEKRMSRENFPSGCYHHCSLQRGWVTHHLFTQ